MNITKKEFIESWYEHIDALSRLCRMTHIDHSEKITQYIKSLKESVRIIAEDRALEFKNGVYKK